MPIESFAAAAAQVEPVYYDKEATVNKTCEWIRKAGREGVNIVVFPESPHSRLSVLVCGDPAVGRIACRAKKVSKTGTMR